MRPTAVLWERTLSDLPADVAEAALMMVLATSRYFPTVADIRAAAAQIQNPQAMDASEAWGQVAAALRKFGLYQAKEAMEYLSPDVAAMVQRFGWYELCHADKIDVIRGQFMRAWDAFAKGRQEMAVLPASVRVLIEGMAEQKSLPGKAVRYD